MSVYVVHVVFVGNAEASHPAHTEREREREREKTEREKDREREREMHKDTYTNNNTPRRHTGSKIKKKKVAQKPAG